MAFRQKSQDLYNFILKQQNETHRELFSDPAFDSIATNNKHFDWWVFPSSSLHRKDLSVDSQHKDGVDIFQELSSNRDYCRKYADCLEKLCNAILDNPSKGSKINLIRLAKAAESLVGMTDYGTRPLTGIDKGRQDGLFTSLAEAFDTLNMSQHSQFNDRNKPFIDFVKNKQSEIYREMFSDERDYDAQPSTRGRSSSYAFAAPPREHSALPSARGQARQATSSSSAATSSSSARPRRTTIFNPPERVAAAERLRKSTGAINAAPRRELDARGQAGQMRGTSSSASASARPSRGNDIFFTPRPEDGFGAARSATRSAIRTNEQQQPEHSARGAFNSGSAISRQLPMAPGGTSSDAARAASSRVPAADFHAASSAAFSAPANRTPARQHFTPAARDPAASAAFHTSSSRGPAASAASSAPAHRAPPARQSVAPAAARTSSSRQGAAAMQLTGAQQIERFNEGKDSITIRKGELQSLYNEFIASIKSGKRNTYRTNWGEKKHHRYGLGDYDRGLNGKTKPKLDEYENILKLSKMSSKGKGRGEESTTETLPSAKTITQDLRLKKAKELKPESLDELKRQKKHSKYEKDSFIGDKLFSHKRPQAGEVVYDVNFGNRQNYGGFVLQVPKRTAQEESKAKLSAASMALAFMHQVEDRNGIIDLTLGEHDLYKPGGELSIGRPIIIEGQMFFEEGHNGNRGSYKEVKELALAAPKLDGKNDRPNGDTLDTAKYLFYTAYNGFKLCKDSNPGKDVTVRSGLWGAGAFKNSSNVSMAMQILASKEAGINLNLSHSFDKWKIDYFKDIILPELNGILTKEDTVEEKIELTFKLCINKEKEYNMQAYKTQKPENSAQSPGAFAVNGHQHGRQ